MIVYLTVFLVLLMKIAALNVIGELINVATAWCLEGDQCGICRFWANNYFACLVKKTGMVVNGE